MNSQHKRVCFLVTDAISFNVLCEGQLEYFSTVRTWNLSLISGGDENEINHLKQRKIGLFFNAGFVRKPSLLFDFRSLIRLIVFFTTNRFDLVVFSTPKALMIGSLASFLTRQPLRVALIRGRAYENYTGIKRLAFLLMDRVALRLSHKTLFVSQSLMRNYLTEGVADRGNSLVLGGGSSNGVDTSRFKPALVDRKQLIEDLKLPFEKSDFIVLIVGRICRDKGVEDSGRVVRLLKDEHIKFIFVGRIEDDCGFDVIEGLRRDFPTSVVHIDHVIDIVRYFQCTDLHLFLSHREGFGNVGLEAAACGVPTVAFDVVGVRDCVKDGVTGLLFPLGEVDAVAHYIHGVKTTGSSGFKPQMVRQSIVDNYDQNLVWKRYGDYFEDCMNSSA